MRAASRVIGSHATILGLADEPSRRNQGDHRGIPRQLGHRRHQVHRLVLLGLELDARRGRALGRRFRQPAAPAPRRAPGEEGGRQGAPVRLRSRALRLRLRRLDHPVLGRWRVLALRGRRKAHAPAPARERVAAVPRARASRSCSSRSRCAQRCGSRTTCAASRAGCVHAAREAPELPVVLLEDIAALIGLVFAFIGVGLT